ncbi:heme o synthase [Paenibacillus thermoaerophilus]|uniref:Protoheme IX farnesyltransferase n=1 Tax=Paenibacillus thermoaerophilus TaxID=1215385 RepID=A0ABW2V179_9BACL|nr:protoheme IX farnesyltransferase [Paenibacillus thermoaerophilus]
MASNAGTVAREHTEPSAESRKPTWRDFYQLAKPGILFSNSITVFGGFWIASGQTGERIDFLLLLWTLLGSALVMASGCVLNNYLDRDLDKLMTRTQKRATARGAISPRVVMWYGITLGVVGLGVLYLLANPLAALLGFAGLLVYVWVYTAWLKRTSVYSTSIGGISGAIPPMIGFTAVSGELGAGAWILFLIMFLWQPPHFWALGIRRKEEYRAAGYPLLPVVQGNHATKLAMMRYTIMLVPGSLLLYLYGYVGEIYVIAATILGMIWVVMTLRGFQAQDDEAWARKMFVYSINYLTLLFLVMVIDTNFVSATPSIPFERIG